MFGASERADGSGWFIFENGDQLKTASVCAGLLAVFMIGLMVENVSVQTVENVTVRRWGMQA